MGLLDSNYEQLLDGDIRLRRLLRDTDLLNNQLPYIAMSDFKPRSRYNPIRLNDLEHISPDKLGIIQNCFNCPDKTVIAGNIDWSTYGITEINCEGRLSFVHGDSVPNVSKITTTDKLTFQYNFRNCCDIELTAPIISVMGLLYSFSARNSCTFNCQELQFSDLPKSFAGIRGHIGTLRINVMDFADVEEFGSCVIQQDIGPGIKKIRKLTDVRAFFNNPKKYNNYWVHPNELIDANQLIKNLQLESVLTEYLYLRDCNFEMVFHKRDKWYCTDCSKR